jgi:cell division protein FtsX/septal ring factor EnvC (AmiA/AmiB activator)
MAGRTPRRLATAFRSGLRGIRATPLVFAASVGTMAAGLLLLGVFLLVIENMRGMVERFGHELRVVAFLHDGAGSDPPAVDALRARAVELAGVSSVEYVSPEAALERLRSDLGGDAGILEGLEGNPLPASLELELRPEARGPSQVQALADALAALPEIDEVRYGAGWVETYARVLRAIEWGGAVLALFLLLVLGAIVAGTVQLAVHAREEEIEILRLVGASSWYVRLPFYLEGALQGAVAATLAVALLYALLALGLPWIRGPLELLLGRAELVFLGAFEVALLLLRSATAPAGSRPTPASSARSSGAAWIGLLGLGSLVLLRPGPAPGADERRRLDQIRTEIEAREEQAQEYAEEAEGYLGELDALDRDLSETRRSIRLLRSRQRTAEEELRQARAAFEAAAGARDRSREELEIRLVALYKSQAAAGIPALYTARDVQELARRRAALGRIIQHDRELFERHAAAQLRWREARDRKESLVAELAAAARQVALREDRSRRDLVERRNLVALLRTRADRERKAAEELRRAAERLSEVLESLPADGRAPTGTGLVRGRVPAPVAGPIRLGFGRQIDQEYGTETLRNGVEIEADPGAPVRAVADGRAMFAGWFRGYGRLVILDHGSGHATVSAYLDELTVEAGDAVPGGQVIGTVAETGPIGGPGLYFEIRMGGKPVDPRGWLLP